MGFAETQKFISEIKRSHPDYKILGYARESTQGKESIVALRGLCWELKAVGCDRVVGERISGFSGVQRKWLEWAIEEIRRGKYQVLVIPSVTRLSRRLRGNIELQRLLEGLGCILYCMELGQIETESTAGWSRFHNAALRAEEEVRITRDRTNRGWRTRKRRKRPACSAPPFGYRRTENGARLELDPENYPNARIRIEAYLRNKGAVHAALVEIYQATGEKIPRTTFREWLKNPALRGHTLYRSTGELCMDTHEGLISEEEAEQIESIIQRHKKIKGKAATREIKNPLTGLLFCSACEGRLHRAPQSYKGTIYEYLIHSPPAPGTPQCEQKIKIKPDTVIKEVNFQLARKAQEIASKISENPSDTPKSLKESKLEASLQQLRETRRTTGMAALDSVIQDAEDELLRLRRTRSQQSKQTIEREQRAHWLAREELWAEATTEELYAIYQDFVRRVEVGPQSVESVQFWL